MRKTKQDYLDDLIAISFRIDEKLARQEDKLVKLQRMASLARQGFKDCAEYKALDLELKYPQVVDFGNEMNELRQVVRRLKKYKWEASKTAAGYTAHQSQK